MTDPQAIGTRLTALKARVAGAARRAGRDLDDIRLIAVSKRHGIDAIRAAYAAGQRDFGENFAQELERKRDALADLQDLRWHFIGGLQRNKARRVVGCALVQTVDRLPLAEAIARRADPARPQEVLVQVNFDEPQKSGVRPEHLNEVLAAVAALPGLRLKGLMTLPPRGTPEETRRWFARLRQLLRAARDALSLPPEVHHLSMGMSADFEVAVEEGATLVRVGTALFGPRPAPPET